MIASMICADVQPEIVSAMPAPAESAGHVRTDSDLRNDFFSQMDEEVIAAWRRGTQREEVKPLLMVIAEEAEA